ncbi:Putative ribonuclease H protein At1g65750 [Linum grandiflorum]
MIFSGLGLRIGSLGELKMLTMRFSLVLLHGSVGKNRNECVFQGAVVSCNQLLLRVLNWIAGVRETMRVGTMACLDTRSTRSKVLVGREAARGACVTINTDGSVLNPSGATAAGGLIRDNQGRCLAAFAANLGRCTITRTEIRAATFGLHLAWSMGYRTIKLQLDSTTAISAITGQEISDLRHRSCINEARELISRDWVLRVTHTFCEGNRAADLLAHHGHSLSFVLHVIDPLPHEVNDCIRTDSVGVFFPRHVPLIN